MSDRSVVLVHGSYGAVNDSFAGRPFEDAGADAAAFSIWWSFGSRTHTDACTSRPGRWSVTTTRRQPGPSNSSRRDQWAERSADSRTCTSLTGCPDRGAVLDSPGVRPSPLPRAFRGSAPVSHSALEFYTLPVVRTARRQGAVRDQPGARRPRDRSSRRPDWQRPPAASAPSRSPDHRPRAPRVPYRAAAGPAPPASALRLVAEGIEAGLTADGPVAVEGSPRRAWRSAVSGCARSVR